MEDLHRTTSNPVELGKLAVAPSGQSFDDMYSGMRTAPPGGPVSGWEEEGESKDKLIDESIPEQRTKDKTGNHLMWTLREKMLSPVGKTFTTECFYVSRPCEDH